MQMQMIVSVTDISVICAILTYYKTHNVTDWAVKDNVCAINFR